MIKHLIQKIFGGNKQARDMKVLFPLVTRINAFYETLGSQPDEVIRGMTAEFRERLEKGETVDDLLPEAFAVVKEACRRHVGKKWMAAGNEIAWDMVPFNVQLAGAAALHQGKIAEMATGEGKTLVAIMPLYLNGLEGKGAHLVTVNDYLAQRDSEWMRPIFEYLGMTVGCILTDMDPEVRREMYSCDITYGTNHEFGFDYLRDNMARTKEHLVQRGHHYAIVDEVDSVLIDEARTPLIISGPVDRSTHRYDKIKPMVENLVQKQTYLINKMISEVERLIEEEPENPRNGIMLLQIKKGAPKNRRFMKLMQEAPLIRITERAEMDAMRDKAMHEVEADLFFVVDEKGSNIELTEKGRQAMNPSDPNMFLLPDIVDEIARVEATPGLEPDQKERKKEEIRSLHEIRSEELHNISQLLRAYMLFEKDDEYIVQDNHVIIVDEFTGRLMPGRRWSDGLHQAVEAKEGVTIEKETQTLATITLQNYFRMYKKLAGMTGTAETEAQEFVHTYGMDVVVIPTNRPIRRADSPDRIFRTKREKYNAIVEEIQRLNKEGLPVLVGTVSVEVSELLSRMLKRVGISHNVLNAKNHAREAEIVREAGKPGTVTIATNMAGRGTDIKLGPGVVRRNGQKIENPDDPGDPGENCEGGLQIIGTERHEARRIDRQLRGRAGRQGDPGASQFFISFEDDLMRLFGSDRLAGILNWLGMEEGEMIQHKRLNSYIEKAQQKIESINFERRKNTLEYDDVMNRQREVIYGLRRDILLGGEEELRAIFLDTVNDGLFDEFTRNYGDPEKSDPSEWDTNGFLSLIRRTVPGINLDDVRPGDAATLEDFIASIMEHVRDSYDERVKVFGPEAVSRFVRAVMLHCIDTDWRDHLLAIDELREGIHLRAYAQKDPKIEYQIESRNLFDEMIYNSRKEIFIHFFKSPSREQEDRSVEKISYQKAQVDVFSADGIQEAQARAAAGGAPGAEAPEGGRERSQPFRRKGPKLGPNDPCPCGSGKKFKKCCGAHQNPNKD